ncbi:MAG: glycosyltransferase family 4 protein [Bacteroidales bacterium]
MKIAILTDTPPLILGNKGEYNGRGWIDSYIIRLALEPEIEEIYVVFNSRIKQPIQKEGKITYIPIKNALTYEFKIFNVIPRQMGIWECAKNEARFAEVLRSITPDIIHIFGSEWFGIQLLNYEFPNIMVQIQGVAERWYSNYYPEQFRSFHAKWELFLKSLMHPKAMIWGISYLHQYRAMGIAAKRESKALEKSSYCAGRTAFDKACILELNRKARYFHIDEILREPFYKSKKWKYNPQKDCIRIVSNISDRIYKGYDIVLETAALLDQYTEEKIIWRIIGLSEHSECVKLFGKNSTMSHVKIEFEGILDEKRIIDILLSSDLYVHPSHIENSSNSICEAQILGVPVLAKCAGGNESMLEHGEAGILFSSAEILAKTIAEIKENEDLLLKISEKGRATAAYRHNSDRIIKDTLSAYKTIANEI